MTIKVLVVDDDPIVRAALGMILTAQPDLVLVGEAADGTAALALAVRQRPDVVLMDIRMPGMDGVEATRRICSATSSATETAPRVLVLTTFDLDEYVYAALRAGASGFLLKDAGPEGLIAAVRTVAAGEAITAPSVTRRLISHYLHQPANRPPAAGRLAALTTREREVLTLITAGRSNPEIADDLHLSASTVSTHIGRILAKLDLRDRVQAVIFGYESGLAPPPGR
jgi:DNA-binding NarL/FixJ family response regulator